MDFTIGHIGNGHDFHGDADFAEIGPACFGLFELLYLEISKNGIKYCFPLFCEDFGEISCWFADFGEIACRRWGSFFGICLGLCLCDLWEFDLFLGEFSFVIEFGGGDLGHFWIVVFEICVADFGGVGSSNGSWKNFFAWKSRFDDGRSVFWIDLEVVDFPTNLIPNFSYSNLTSSLTWNIPAIYAISNNYSQNRQFCSSTTLTVSNYGQISIFTSILSHCSAYNFQEPS